MVQVYIAHSYIELARVRCLKSLANGHQLTYSVLIFTRDKDMSAYSYVLRLLIGIHIFLPPPSLPCIANFGILLHEGMYKVFIESENRLL